MKAVRVREFGGSDRLRVEELPSLIPGRGEVLVSMRAAGVNPVDTYIRSGTYPVRPDLPYTPGLDGAGIVSGIGANVSHLRVGQRVYISRPKTGTYAEECLCGVENAYALPANASFEQGAALGIPYLTAYRALFQLAHARPCEAVLIHGASGGVGTAAVQFARAHGMKVIGTASTEIGRQLVLQCGADHALDHASDEVTRRVASLTCGTGPNVILEMMANKNLATDLKVAAKRGKIVVVGNRGSTEVNMRDAMSKDLTLYTMSAFNATTDEVNEANAAVTAGVAAAFLRPLVGRMFPLHMVARAHDAVSDTGSSAGKVVLSI